MAMANSGVLFLSCARRQPPGMQIRGFLNWCSHILLPQFEPYLFDTNLLQDCRASDELTTEAVSGKQPGCERKYETILDEVRNLLQRQRIAIESTDDPVRALETLLCPCNAENGAHSRPLFLSQMDSPWPMENDRRDLIDRAFSWSRNFIHLGLDKYDIERICDNVCGGQDARPEAAVLTAAILDLGDYARQALSSQQLLPASEGFLIQKSKAFYELLGPEPSVLRLQVRSH